MQRLSAILSDEKKRITPEESSIDTIERETKQFMGVLKKELARAKIKASVFLGGSFAKGTFLRKEKQDIDIFVRFSHAGDLSNMLERVVKRSAQKIKRAYVRLHGSRDYFQIDLGNFYFEIVPVQAVSNPRKAENVTDLSYFHVAYVKRAGHKLEGEIRLAKAFFEAQEVYGAESYIGGFSGYGVECLIIHYKSFLKMLKAFAQAKQQLVLDPARHYKNAQEILIELNESKRKGPIVLVDPTFKERNVLAALSQESFERAQKAARDFLVRPSTRFFSISDFSVEHLKNRAKKIGASLICVELATDKPVGDIAGTKMKKFTRLLEQKLSNRYAVSTTVFRYFGKDNAEVYFIVKPRALLILNGPPATMLEHVRAFKKQHSKAYLKKGKWYTTAVSAPVLQGFTSIIVDKKLLEQMDISKALMRML